MMQIAYLSRAVMPLPSGGYEALVDECQSRNRRDTVTGLLLYDGARFVQAFEGPDAAVDACMKRIAGDTRHDSIQIRRRQPVTKREFGTFAMAAIMPGTLSPIEFSSYVMQLVSDVSCPHLKALFVGFAVLGRCKSPVI